MGLYCKGDLKLDCCGDGGEIDLRVGRKSQLDLVTTAWILGMRWEGGMGSVKNLTFCFETG